MRERRLRVLVAEGGPGEASLALRALFPDVESKLDLTVVSSIGTLIPTAKMIEPDAVFLDLALAKPEVLETVRRVRRAAPGIPLITIGDETEKELATKSLAEGAMDYVLKGHLDTRTVDRVLKTAMERNTLAGLADLLRDPLTGLYNRDGFVTLSARTMQSYAEAGGMLVLLTAKLRNHEALKAEFGPGAGDAALKDVGSLLWQSFRRTDVIARIDRAEFAVLAVDAAEPTIPVLKQRIDRHVAMKNKERGAWGALQLELEGRFLSAKENRAIDELWRRSRGGDEREGSAPKEPDVLDGEPARKAR